MSCFVMTNDDICEIALFCEEILNMGYDFLGMNAPKTLHRCLKDSAINNAGFFCGSKIFNFLYAMNLSAYAECYKEPELLFNVIPMYTEPNVGVPSCHRAKWAEGHFQVQPWHYRMAKLLDCWIYQCTEGKHPDTELYKAMGELRNTLYEFIIQNTQEYFDAPWGGV